MWRRGWFDRRARMGLALLAASGRCSTLPVPSFSNSSPPRVAPTARPPKGSCRRSAAWGSTWSFRWPFTSTTSIHRIGKIASHDPTGRAASMPTRACGTPRSLSTPQAIIDGGTVVQGADEPAIRSAIAAAASRPAARLELAAHREKGRAVLEIDIERPAELAAARPRRGRRDLRARTRNADRFNRQDLSQRLRGALPRPDRANRTEADREPESPHRSPSPGARLEPSSSRSGRLPPGPQDARDPRRARGAPGAARLSGAGQTPCRRRATQRRAASYAARRRRTAAGISSTSTPP